MKLMRKGIFVLVVRYIRPTEVGIMSMRVPCIRLFSFHRQHTNFRTYIFELFLKLYLRHLVSPGTKTSSQLAKFVEDVNPLVGGVGNDDVIVNSRTNRSRTVESTWFLTRTAVSKDGQICQLEQHSLKNLQLWRRALKILRITNQTLIDQVSKLI